MKRFRFRLDGVLRVRRVMDQQARQNLAGAIADRVAAETALADLQDTVRRRIDDMDTLQSAGDVDVRRILQHDADLVTLRRCVDRAEEVVEEAVVSETECAAALAEARRQLKVVESLREKALRAHRDEIQKSELADIDEHVTRRHAVASAAIGESER